MINFFKLSWFSILLFSITLSCNNHNKSYNSKKQVAKIKKDVDEYAFFPNDAGLKTGDVYIIDTSAFYNTVGIQLCRKISESEVNKIKKEKYVKAIYSTNECIVTINDYLNKETQGQKLINQKSKVNSNCNDKKIPIPNFFSIKSDLKNPISKVYSLFIVNIKYGLYTKRINQKKSSMPENMKHGEVSGILLDEKTSQVIYFVHKW